jgi:hypothetical protein
MSLRPEFPSTLASGCPEHPHGRTFVVYSSLTDDRDESIIRSTRVATP